MTHPVASLADSKNVPSDNEVTLRGITAHLPVCILATIPATWDPVALGIGSPKWEYERRANQRNGQATVVGTAEPDTFFQQYDTFHKTYLVTMQKREEILQADRLRVANVHDNLFPARPSELTITIELEQKYGNPGAAMAPTSMPELFDTLTEIPSSIEEEASEYLAPTAPHLRALAAQSGR